MGRREAWTEYVTRKRVPVETRARARPTAAIHVPTAAEKLIDQFVFECYLAGLPAPEREFKFLEGRRYAFDCAWPELKIALECDGGVFLEGGGRHNRGAGYRKDCVKFAEAAILGWRVIHVLPEHIKDGHAVDWIQRALKGAS